MIKSVIYLLVFIMGMGVTGEPLMAEERSPKSNEVQIILYQKGKQKLLDNKLPYVKEVLYECERLFITADSGYKLIMNKERIEQIKKKQIALEVIYLNVQTGIIRGGLKIYFTRLLIPLTGDFSNGTVFFAGIHEYELKRDKPDLLPEHNYNYIDHYRAFNFVLNTKGLNRLKEILGKIGVEIE